MPTIETTSLPLAADGGEHSIWLSAWSSKQKEAIYFREKMVKPEADKSEIFRKITSYQQVEKMSWKNMEYYQKCVDNKIFLSKYTKEMKHVHFIRKKSDVSMRKLKKCDQHPEHLKQLINQREADLKSLNSLQLEWDDSVFHMSNDYYSKL